MIKYKYYIRKFLGVVDNLEAARQLLHLKIDNGSFWLPDKVIQYFIDNAEQLTIGDLSILINCQSERNKYYSDLTSGFLKSNSIQELSLNLGFYGDSSSEHLLTTLKNGYYSKFYLPKKTGGFREISIPEFNLSLLQKRLSFVLSLLYKPKSNAHGFILDKGIITNSAPHVKMRSVLNIDIKDFFPSITLARVLGLFSKKPFLFNNEIRKTLAQICCHDNHLPQGAATSPVITNFICKRLDDKLKKLSKYYKCRYSRYADDITFSYSSKLDTNRLINEMKFTLLEEGFEVNEKKIRIQNRNNRQQVTGIVVNDKINVRRDFIRNLRAILHCWKVKGVKEATHIYNRKYSRYKLIGIPNFKASVRGKIEYVGMVRGKDDEIYASFLEEFEILKNQ